MQLILRQAVNIRKFKKRIHDIFANKMSNITSTKEYRLTTSCWQERTLYDFERNNVLTISHWIFDICVCFDIILYITAPFYEHLVYGLFCI